MIEERPQSKAEAQRILFNATKFEQFSSQIIEQEEQDENDLVDEDERFRKENNQTVKESSPFTKHFLSVQQEVRQVTSSSSGTSPNALRNETFIEFLQSDFMPYIFLWGGFVLRNQEFDRPTTHMVDSSIEAWFRTRKLLIKVPVYPARYIHETVYETLGQCKRTAKYMLDDEGDVEKESIEETQFGAVDYWSKKRQLVQTKKKHKGGVYQKPSRTLEKYNDDKISIKEATTKNATGNNMISNGKISTFRIVKPSKAQVSSQLDSSNSSQVVIKPLMYRINGVDIDDASLKEQLLSTPVMLSDNTIDAYLQCISNKNKEKFMASSIHLSTIVLDGKCRSKQHWTSFEIVCGPVFHLKPGNKCGHWTFLCLNMRRREIIHLDPLNNSPTHQAKYEENILKFIGSRKEYSDLEFKHISIAHPTQSDSVSCGVFVCMFAKILLSSYDYIVERGEIDFNIEGFRQKIYDTVVQTAKRI